MNWIRGIIIGLDPGVNFGIAILDVHGKVVNLVTKRNVKRSDVIKYITKFGRPLIVTSDVNPPPRTVEKIAHAFGCKLFIPEKSLTTKEKYRLTKEYHKLIKTDHETDALASCIKAWKHYRKFLKTIENTLNKYGLSTYYSEVVRKLLKEKRENIIKIIDELIAKERKIVEIEKRRSKEREIILKLEKKLVKKKQEVEYLRKELALLNRRLASVSTKLKIFSKIKLSLRELKKLREENRKMRKYIELLRKIEILSKNNLVPVLKMSMVSPKLLEELEKYIGLRDRVILLNTNENLTFLNQFGIKCLLAEKPPARNLLGKLEFPVIPKQSIPIHTVYGIDAVEEEKLEKVLAKFRKEGLIEWLKEYRKRRE